VQHNAPFHRRSKKWNVLASGLRPELVALSCTCQEKESEKISRFLHPLRTPYRSLSFSFACVRGCYFSLCQGVSTRRGVTGLVWENTSFFRTAKLIVYTGTFHKIPPETVAYELHTILELNKSWCKNQFDTTCKKGNNVFCKIWQVFKSIYNWLFLSFVKIIFEL